tara:strand:+ start:973 stop:1128 length:156 start_codon:yes stop_codon:yes gene_type:complete
MAFLFLIAGITVFFIIGKFGKDWASGMVGFIFGGTLFWLIRLAIKIINFLS